MNSSKIYIEPELGITHIDADYVAPGIASVYLLREGDRLALIETGTAYTVKPVFAAIEAMGLTPDHLDWVIPTHIHLDHAGGVGEFIAQCPNAKLVVHPRGVRHMIDPSKLEAGTMAVYGEEVYRKLYGQLKPVPADRIIEAPDNFELDFNGRLLRFLDTPGHALHHFCVHDTKTNSLFTGDTFGVSYRSLDRDDGRPFIFATTTPVHFDPEAMRASMLRLANLKPDRICLTHYGVIDCTPDVLEQLLTSIDVFVEITKSESNNTTNRTEAINQKIKDWVGEKLVKEDYTKQVDSALETLDMDMKLNAQGLDVWLKNLEKSA